VPYGCSGWVRKTSPLLGFDARTVQPLSSRYTVYAIPVQLTAICFLIFAFPRLTQLKSLSWRWKAEAEELVNYLNTVYCQLGLRPQLLRHADYSFNYTERLWRDVIISVDKTRGK
jgi:hypothetical protein